MWAGVATHALATTLAAYQQPSSHMAGETGVLGAKRGSMFTVQGFCGLLMM